jgi:hypothetical protein
LNEWRSPEVASTDQKNATGAFGNGTMNGESWFVRSFDVGVHRHAKENNRGLPHE